VCKTWAFKYATGIFILFFLAQNFFLLFGKNAFKKRVDCSILHSIFKVDIAMSFNKIQKKRNKKKKRNFFIKLKKQAKRDDEEDRGCANKITCLQLIFPTK
jgi:predicted membrane metal-binding protein